MNSLLNLTAKIRSGPRLCRSCYLITHGEEEPPPPSSSSSSSSSLKTEKKFADKNSCESCNPDDDGDGDGDAAEYAERSARTRFWYAGSGSGSGSSNGDGDGERSEEEGKDSVSGGYDVVGSESGGSNDGGDGAVKNREGSEKGVSSNSENEEAEVRGQQGKSQSKSKSKSKKNILSNLGGKLWPRSSSTTTASASSQTNSEDNEDDDEDDELLFPRPPPLLLRRQDAFSLVGADEDEDGVVELSLRDGVPSIYVRRVQYTEPGSGSRSQSQSPELLSIPSWPNSEVGDVLPPVGSTGDDGEGEKGG